MVNPTKIVNDEFFSARSAFNKETGCIEWTRYISENGYGTVKHKRKQHVAHRFMWEYKFGPIPDGMIICHKCDNRKCINPDHLFIGTTQDNVTDKMMKGRFVACTGERSGTAKLTEDQIASIRLDSRVQHVIAKDYGISQANVSIIKKGDTWSHLPVFEDKRLTVQDFANLMSVNYGKFRHYLLRRKLGFRHSLEKCGVTL